jgi:hypothetical protein
MDKKKGKVSVFGHEGAGHGDDAAGFQDARSAGAALEQVLISKKGAIIEAWHHAVMATYAAEARAFLTSEKDPFCNPVGHVLHRTGDALFEIAMTGVERERAEEDLADIVRIRAVQDFSPSQALSFVDAMRQAIRHEVLPVVAEEAGFRHLLRIESRLHEAMLVAVDLYVACKKRIDDIRVKEAQAEKERLLKLIRAMGGAGESGDLSASSGRGVTGGTDS